MQDKSQIVAFRHRYNVKAKEQLSHGVSLVVLAVPMLKVYYTIN